MQEQSWRCVTMTSLLSRIITVRLLSTSWRTRQQTSSAPLLPTSTKWFGKGSSAASWLQTWLVITRYLDSSTRLYPSLTTTTGRTSISYVHQILCTSYSSYSSSSFSSSRRGLQYRISAHAFNILAGSIYNIYIRVHCCIITWPIVVY